MSWRSCGVESGTHACTFSGLDSKRLFVVGFFFPFFPPQPY